MDDGDDGVDVLGVVEGVGVVGQVVVEKVEECCEVHGLLLVVGGRFIHHRMVSHITLYIIGDLSLLWVLSLYPAIIIILITAQIYSFSPRVGV